MLSNDDIHRTDISAAFIDGNAKDTGRHRNLVLFRTIGTDTAAYSGVIVTASIYVGMVINDFYRSLVSGGQAGN